MHCAEHTGNELINTIALLNQWHQRSDPTFVVRPASEVGKDEFLEGVDLILKGHEIGDGLIAFVGVVDGFQTDVLLVLKSSCPRSAQPFEYLQLSLAPLNSGCCLWNASLARR